MNKPGSIWQTPGVAKTGTVSNEAAAVKIPAWQGNGNELDRMVQRVYNLDERGQVELVRGEAGKM